MQPYITTREGADGYLTDMYVACKMNGSCCQQSNLEFKNDYINETIYLNAYELMIK